MKVLVTGACGFLGRHVVDRLLKDGHEVTIVSTGSEPPLPVHKTLYLSLDGFDWQALRGQQAIIHLMANNDTRCMDRSEMQHVNFHAPCKLFQKALLSGCRRFVYASSAAVYGNQPAPYTELTPLEPLNPYARSKADFDRFAMEFAQLNGASVTGLRYCNIYGPGEEHKGRRMSMIGQLIRQMRTGGPRLFKDGNQRRDWVYVKDAADAVILAMGHSEDYGQIYNIGSGTSVTFNDVVTAIKGFAAKKGWATYSTDYIDCPFPEEYQNHTEQSIEKARRNLAYSPKYDLLAGIEEYIISF